MNLFILQNKEISPPTAKMEPFCLSHKHNMEVLLFKFLPGNHGTKNSFMESDTRRDNIAGHRQVSKKKKKKKKKK